MPVMSEKAARLNKRFRRKEAKAIDYLTTARAFINDGAYASGARYLRLAADEYEASQVARNEALEELCRV